MEHDKQNVLLFWTVFCSFTCLRTHKISILKKWKRTWRFYKFVPQVAVIWCMVAEIWSATDKILFVILDCFLLFYTTPPPSNNPNNQNFVKMKKAPGGIIILHRCSKNENNMINGSWDTEHDRQNFLSFWTTFCLFTQSINPKNGIFEKMRKSLEDIITLYTCTRNKNRTMYDSWDMECDGQNFFIILDYFLPRLFLTFLPPPPTPPPLPILPLTT